MSTPLYVRARQPMTPAEAGAIGARNRWGRKRTLRLDEIGEPVRSAIEALIAAEQHAQEREQADGGGDAA